jgi:hypothetical protein
MKKLILSVMTVAALAAGGAAFAQSGSAEGQLARGFGNTEHAPGSDSGIPWYDQPRDSDRARANQYYEGNAPWNLSNGRQRGVPYAAYARTRNDRDGDGVRNNRDRYPDDPRYR